ncbi:MAG: 3-hydroxybutyryl-CoA dehydrogenase, partial [Sphingobacteriia bacterium 35-40-5]
MPGLNEMEKLVVIGCGTMGHSIALNAAWAGMPVKMYGVDTNDIQNGLSGVTDKLNTLFKNDLISKDQKDQILNRITGTDLLSEAVDGATFIIECIPEVLELKNDLFRK